MGLVWLDLSPSIPPSTSSFFRGVVGSWMTCLVLPEPETTTTPPFLISPVSILNLDSRMLSNSASCSMVRLEMAGLLAPPLPLLLPPLPASLTVIPRA